MTAAALDPGYFDRLYAEKADPWDFAGNAYEMAKYAATVAALPRPRYASAVEVGCSIGFLTEKLAARCDRLLGTDVADAALDAARKRCAALPQVSFERSGLPDTAPAGPFDLIVFSEVLYYFDRAGLEAIVRGLGPAMPAGTDIVMVHWLGPTPDYPMTGDEAVDAFLGLLGPHTLMQRARTPQYRLDVVRLD